MCNDEQNSILCTFQLHYYFSDFHPDCVCVILLFPPVHVHPSFVQLAPFCKYAPVCNPTDLARTLLLI